MTNILSFQPLSDDRLEEAIRFLRSANPFSQHAWGWDTGRFLDFRWGNNVLRADTATDFFERHGKVFYVNGDVVALAISEVGGDDHCILTAASNPAVLFAALQLLVGRHDGEQLIFYPSDEATWIHEILMRFDFQRGAVAGQEWEYDLTTLTDTRPVPDGFIIESLSEDRDADYAGIAACLEGAFGGSHDRMRVLRSLETNPMFRPELSIVARAADDTIAAYCRGTVDPDSGVCGIDPVATHPEFQGRGLGTSIVTACFAAQARLGGTMSFIGSAPEPSPGSRLYRRLGPASVTNHSQWTKTLT